MASAAFAFVRLLTKNPCNLAHSSHNRKIVMTNLSPRHVQPEEALRLGVQSGWYSIKVSGTFVSGPHATQEECVSKINELNPAPLKRRR